MDIPPPPGNQIFFRIHRVLDKLHENFLSTRSKEDVDWLLNLTARQKHALVAVSHMTLRTPEGIPLKELAEVLGMALPSASVFVEGMVRKGLFVRTQNPNDRRSICITLSEKGKMNFKMLCSYMDEETRKLMDSVPPEERAIFVKIVDQFYNQLTNQPSD